MHFLDFSLIDSHLLLEKDYRMGLQFSLSCWTLLQCLGRDWGLCHVRCKIRGVLI